MDQGEPGAGAGGVRVSDAEREQVVRFLSEQAGAGRLTLAEHEERVALVYDVTTRAELERVTADLPAMATPAAQAPSTTSPSPAERRRTPTRWVVSVMGGNDKKGRWRVGSRVNVVTVMGGSDIDLRHAEIDADEVTVVATAVMGGIDVYVPDSVDVEVSGFALMGGNDERGSMRSPRPGGRRIHIKAFGLMGGVDVWRVPEEGRDRGLREARRLAKAAEDGAL